RYSARPGGQGECRGVSNHAGRQPMPTSGGGKRWWCAGLLLAAGCWTTERDLRPPPHPEEFVLPPATETRFSDPPEFPKEALKDKQSKKKLDEMGMPGQTGPGGSRFGAGSGMRGM